MPHLHDPAGSVLAPADRLADALLEPAYPRDGVSLLGGEPVAQPEGLLALVRALRTRGCPHLLADSGYTYEHLRRRAARAGEQQGRRVAAPRRPRAGTCEQPPRGPAIVARPAAPRGPPVGWRPGR